MTKSMNIELKSFACWMVVAFVFGVFAGGLAIVAMLNGSRECACLACDSETVKIDNEADPKDAAGKRKTADDESLDAVWGENKIDGDPFKVVNVGEVCPDALLRNGRNGGDSHRRCFGRIAGFSVFDKFIIDISTNDSKVLAIELHSDSPLLWGGSADRWLTNCVHVCNSHFKGLEWGMLRDRETGKKDALCARRKGDVHFASMFIVAKPDAREEIDPSGSFVLEYDSCCKAVLRVEIPEKHIKEFGGPSLLFADRYLYCRMPITEFER